MSTRNESEPTIEEIRAWVETKIYLGDKYRRIAWDDDRRILTAIRDRLSAPPEGVSDLDKSELDLERELWLKTAKEKETLETALSAANERITELERQIACAKKMFKFFDDDSWADDLTETAPKEADND
jgi:hypothetical protein